jgi:hypothetical protein
MSLIPLISQYRSSLNDPSKLNVDVPKSKGLKKLQPLGPITSMAPVETKVSEQPQRKILLKDYSFETLKKFLPSITLPQINTLIVSKPHMYENIKRGSASPQKALPMPKMEQVGKFYIDESRNILVVGEGAKAKEFALDTISDFNSRTGKSISKMEAQDIANNYLKLNIKAQEKKGAFIKAIRNKIGLPPE